MELRVPEQHLAQKIQLVILNMAKRVYDVIKIFAAGQCNGAVHGKRLQLLAKFQHLRIVIQRLVNRNEVTGSLTVLHFLSEVTVEIVQRDFRRFKFAVHRRPCRGNFIENLGCQIRGDAGAAH